MRVVQYAIANSLNQAEMIDLVNKAIGDGWQPLGAPFMVRALIEPEHRNSEVLCQALVRYEAEPCKSCDCGGKSLG